MSGFPIRIAFLLIIALWPAAASAERLPLRTYTTADGLPHDRIKCIYADSRGFLWFCTYDGIARFDGSGFKTYGVGNGLPERIVNDMLEDSYGRYWIATNGGGVARLATARSSDARVTVLSVGTTPQTNRVNVLYEDRTRTLWAGTDDGLFRLETASDPAFTPLTPQLQSRSARPVQVWSMTESRDGRLWIGTSQGLYVRQSDGTQLHHAIKPSLGLDSVWALLTDREGRIWIGHEAGLWVAGTAEAPRLTVAPALSGVIVRELAFASDGSVLAATSRGVLRCTTGICRTYLDGPGFTTELVSGLAEDSEGTLWAAPEDGGVVRLKRNGFLGYDETDGLQSNIVRAILESPAGVLYAVTAWHVINVLDGRKFRSIRPNVALDETVAGEGRYGAYLLDHAGEWWISKGDGLFRFPSVPAVDDLARTSPRAAYTTRNGLADNEVVLLFEDSRGDIWIGTRTPSRDVVTRWDRTTSTFHRYSASDGLQEANAPLAFAEDRGGAVWIGFREGGLARYRHGRFTWLSVRDGVPEGSLNSLYVDREGRLWIASGRGGLGRVDDCTADRPRIITYTTVHGLSSDRITAITDDARGHIYVGAAGVDRIDPATGRMRHYGAGDGLPSDIVTAAWRDRHGTLWFGTRRGLFRFVPDHAGPSAAPAILIGGVRVLDEAYPVAELGETDRGHLLLQPDQNHLQIDFFGISVPHGDTLRYEFKLDGADREWGLATAQRTVTYPHLSQGSYRFSVRAVTPDGVASERPATIAFTILPPVWARAWFLFLVTLLLVAGAVAIHRLRLARVVDVERIRTRIATDLHDDIGANLSKIALLTEVARQEMRGTQEPGSQRFAAVSAIARESLDALSDIVWSVDPTRDRLHDLVQRMRHSASEVLTAGGVTLVFHAPATGGDPDLDVSTRREVFLILKEAVINIVRHAGATRVAIELDGADRWLRLTVRDNGRGFDAADRSEGRGLANMARRAQRIGGTLEIASRPGAGTEIVLRVPTRRRRYRDALRRLARHTNPT